MSVMEYAGMALLISQMFVVATHDPGCVEDLFPDRASVIAHVESSRTLPWLSLRGVKIPGWLSQT